MSTAASAIAATAAAPSIRSRQTRRGCGTAGGMPRSPPPAIHCSSSRRSAALCQRASGSRARHFRTTRSSAPGIFGSIADGTGGSRSRMAAATAAGVGPSNARPRHHLVEHASEGPDVGALVDLTAIELFGAMKATVPNTTPACVSACCVGSSARAVPAAAALARPKSSSFAPVFVSMTLAGFRSRWTRPARWQRQGHRRFRRQCAAPRPAATGPAPAARRATALEVLHDQERPAIQTGEPNRVQMADDSGSPARGPRARAPLRLEVTGRVGGQHLDRDGPIDAGVACPVHLTHAAGADRADDFIGTESRSGSERQAGELSHRRYRVLWGSKTIRSRVPVASAKRPRTSVDGRTLPPSMRAI